MAAARFGSGGLLRAGHGVTSNAWKGRPSAIGRAWGPASYAIGAAAGLGIAG